MDYITPEKMRELEMSASGYGMGAKQLMENSGRAVAEIVLARYGAANLRLSPLPLVEAVRQGVYRHAPLAATAGHVHPIAVARTKEPKVATTMGASGVMAGSSHGADI